MTQFHESLCTVNKTEYCSTYIIKVQYLTMHHSDTSLDDIEVGFVWRDGIDQLIKLENHRLS